MLCRGSVVFEAWRRKLGFSPKRFLIVAAGTHGDVFPLVTLADRLNSRGNEVSFLAPPIYSKWTEGIPGVRFFPLCSFQEYENSSLDFHLLNSRYFPLFMSRYAISWNVAMYRAAHSLIGRNLTLLVADRGMLWADSIIRSRLRIPVIRLQIDPPQFHELQTSNILPWGVVQQNLIARFETSWQKAMEDLDVKQRLGHLSKLTGMGLPSVPRIGLYPNWLARSPRSRFVRKFCFVPPPRLASSCGAEVNKKPAQRLIAFVAGTEGTLSDWSRQFFSIAAAICVRYDYSALLLSGTDPMIYGIAGRSIEWRQFVALSDILPYADLIVHHGGIGTAAAAIEYGVPQIIVPRFTSQFSNAEWIRRLGIGVVMDAYSYTEKQGAEEIRKLLNDRKMRERLRMYKGRCYCEGTILQLIRFLERWSDLPNIQHLY